VFDDGLKHEVEGWQLDFAREVFRAMERRIWGYENWLVVPEGNGKTTFMSELGLYGVDWAPRPWIPLFAHNGDQAKTTYYQAKTFVENTPGLHHRFRCFDGLRTIRPYRGGKPRPGRGMEVCPWDPDANDGFIPFPYFLADELHRHPTLETWRLLKGKCRKRKAVGIGISTAGMPGREFEQARDKMRDTAHQRIRRHGGTIYRGRRHTMVEFRLADPDRAMDPKAVVRVNPLSTITVADIREELASPTFDVGDWKRLKCCIAARSANAAISDEEWARAASDLTEIPEGERIDVGLDLGWKHDTTAILPQWAHPDGWHLWDEATVVVPPRDGSSTHPDRIKEPLLARHERNPIDAIVMDMTNGEDIAAWAADEIGCTVVDRPQGNNHAVRDYKNVMRGLRTGQLRHVRFCPKLTEHSMNAVAWRLPRGDTKFERPNISRTSRIKQDERVIDALDGGGMVYTHVCVEPEPEPTINLDDYRIKVI
jgi:phage terminase large subunit-like protein